MLDSKEIEDKILELRTELKTDRLDMSFGEIMSLYEKEDLFISPEYQRAYRWNENQKSRFIESILLGVPIPPIFVAEDNDGKWELVDGLQRISTILSFFGILKNDLKNNNYFKLIETSLTKKILEDISIDELSVKLQNTIKRSVCRVEILRWDSEFDMRYELFNRLNTGSSPLKPQEVRNCVLLGKFNNLLKEIASMENFINIIESDEEKNEVYIREMYFEELVLRYFSVIFGDLNVEKNIPEYLTNFMKNVNKEEININLELEKEKLINIINFINDNFDKSIFRGGNNRFSENLYETVLYFAYKYFDKYKNIPQEFLSKIDILKDDDEYKKASGFQTHQKSRLKRKFERAEEIFNGI